MSIMARTLFVCRKKEVIGMVDKNFAEKLFKTLVVLKDDECIILVRHKDKHTMIRQKRKNVCFGYDNFE